MNYETSGGLFRDLIRESLNDSSIKILIDQAATQLDSYLKESYWDSKNLLLSKLESFHYVLAKEAYLITVGECLTIQEVITRLSKHIDGDFSFIEKVQVSAWIVESMVSILFKLTRESSDGQIYVQSIFTLDEEESLAKGYIMYPPPKLEVPELNPEVLGSHFNSNDNLNHEVIQLLQDIEWELDPYISSMEELPNTEEFDTPMDLNNWLSHKEQAKSLRDFLVGKKFYFKWNYDKRGRQYMQGYHINLQASGYKKAVMNFGEAYMVNPSLTMP